jgi:hypothetical protein
LAGRFSLSAGENRAKDCHPTSNIELFL